MNIRTKWCNFGLLFTVLVLVGVMALPAPMEAGEQRKGIRFVGLRDGDVLNSGSNTIRVVVTGGITTQQLRS